MRPIALLALGIRLAGAVAPRATAQTGPTTDDALVFSAIIQHTIIPELRRSAQQKVDPPVVLVYGASLPLCSENGAGSRPCRIPGQWQKFLTPDESRKWPGIVAPTETRTALISTLEARNQWSQALRPIGHTRVVMLAPSTPNPELAVNLAYDMGTASFGLPGYSGDHALTYVSFSCGGDCGQSYLFVLRKSNGVWQVEAAWVTAVS
jgi:hypothetical protein